MKTKSEKFTMLQMKDLPPIKSVDIRLQFDQSIKMIEIKKKATLFRRQFYFNFVNSFIITSDYG